MRFWNGIVMYAPRTPDYYALPGTGQCIFRLMHKYQDTIAWNLYWLSKPQTDLIPDDREHWQRYHQPYDGRETRAFYDALETTVLNRMTLGSILSQPPREAIRLLRRADLAHCSFYLIAGGEAWRETLIGRLFLAARLADNRERREVADGVVVVADFIQHRYAPLGSSEYKQRKRPA